MEKANNESLRLSLILSDNLADRVLKVRQMDEFRRCSIAEILRMLIEAGLEAKGYAKGRLYERYENHQNFDEHGDG